MNTRRSVPELQPDFEGLNLDLVSAQMSSRRTEMSLHRTRMSADRTLMSIIRTALSMIGFGFTIFQFFRSVRQAAGATEFPETAARNLGLALVVLGVGLLALGIWNHVGFMLNLRKLRQELVEANVVLPGDKFPISSTLVTAAALMVIGISAFVDMVLRYRPPK